MIGRVFVGAFALLIGACAHVRPAEVADCRLRAIPMFVGTTHPRELAPPGATHGPITAAASPLKQFMSNALVQSRDLTKANAPREVLVLSGGSQHGLFGTGFFGTKARKKAA